MLEGLQMFFGIVGGALAIEVFFSLPVWALCTLGAASEEKARVAAGEIEPPVAEDETVFDLSDIELPSFSRWFHSGRLALAE